MRVIQNISKIKDIQNWFIVDMGYSNGRKSCGVLIDHNGIKSVEDVSFSAMVKMFMDFYDKCENESLGLVIEAPLSIAFDNTMNPCGREFEIKFDKEYTKKKKKKIIATRYWYYGAGATVTLGALEFLQRIKQKGKDKNIYLFEGFVSFKDDTTDKKEEHYKDAERLRKATQNYELPEAINDAEKYKFIGSYLNLEINGIPPIIKVSKDKNEIFII